MPARIDAYPAPASALKSIVHSFARKLIPGTKTRYARNGHSATDIPPKTKGRDGDPMVAAWDGIVHYVDFDSDKNPHRGPLGLQISIEAPDGMGAYYAHLAERVVPDGMRVKAGDLVARMGHTGITGVGGASTHLHFEVLERWNNWKTPRDYFAQLEDARQRLLNPVPAPPPIVGFEDMAAHAVSYEGTESIWVALGPFKWGVEDIDILKQLQAAHIVETNPPGSGKLGSFITLSKHTIDSMVEIRTFIKA